MTVMAAPLTASCLLPDDVPPDLSKSLEASAMARLISCVCDPPPLLPLEVNCFRTYTIRRYETSVAAAARPSIPALQQRFQGSPRSANPQSLPRTPCGERAERPPHR